MNADASDIQFRQDVLAMLADIREELRQLKEAQNPNPLVASAVGGTPDQWRYTEAAKPWARTLQMAGCKIGQTNWPVWKGVVDRIFGGDAQKCADAAAKLPPDRRWPDQVEGSSDTNEKQKKRDQLAFRLRGLGLRADGDRLLEWGTLMQVRGGCKNIKDIEDGIAWIVGVAKKEGMTLRFASEAGYLADQWAMKLKERT